MEQLLRILHFNTHDRALAFVTLGMDEELALMIIYFNTHDRALAFVTIS